MGAKEFGIARRSGRGTIRLGRASSVKARRDTTVETRSGEDGNGMARTGADWQRATVKARAGLARPETARLG